VEDFIEEGEVVGRVLARSVRNVTNPWGCCYNSYQYGPARELTTWQETSYAGPGAGYHRWTYSATAWDSSGRVTAATLLHEPGSGYGPPSACSLGVSYDDRSRTATWSDCSGVLSQKIFRYDANGFPQSRTDIRTDGETIQSWTHTVQSTFSVCR
jgi:hypothetical protein